ncbi:MAG: hypothetical protein P4N59_11485 [Negativicutes bacterium]|nr:hypothetical protein [Negativicutes bacterium]
MAALINPNPIKPSVPLVASPAADPTDAPPQLPADNSSLPVAAPGTGPGFDSTTPAQLAQQKAAPGGAVIQKMLDAGYPAAQVSAWRDGKINEAISAGYKPSDVSTYWGMNPPTAENLQATFSANLAKNKGDLSDAAAPDAQPATSLIGDFAAGFDQSPVGLATHQALAQTILPQHAGLMANVAFGAGDFVGDIPTYVAGAIAAAPAGRPGGPIGMAAAGMAGASGLTASVREGLIADYNTPGGIQNWHQAVAALAPTAIAGAKAAVTGAASAAIGGKVGSVALKATADTFAPAIARTISGGANAAAMAISATNIGASLDGKVASAQDYVTGAILTMGLMGAGHLAAHVVGPGTTNRIVPNATGETVVQHLQEQYVATGVHPLEVAKAAARDKVVAQEVLAPTAADGTRLTPEIDKISPPEPEPPPGPAAQPGAEPPPEPTAEELAAHQGVQDAKLDDTILKVQGDHGEYEPPEQPPDDAFPKEEPESPAEGAAAVEPTLRDDMANVAGIIGKTKKALPDWLSFRKTMAFFQGQYAPLRPLDKAYSVEDKVTPNFEDVIRQIGASKERAGLFFRYGGVKFNPDTNTFEKSNSPSWASAFQMVKEDGGNGTDFSIARISARIVEKDKQGIAMTTPERIAAAYRVMENPETEKLYGRGIRQLALAKDGSIDYGTEAGLFSEKSAGAMKELNRAHIYFARILNPEYEPPAVPGRKMSVRSPVKKVTGSTDQIENPLPFDIANHHLIVAMADRNRALGMIVSKFNRLQALGKVPPELGIEKVPLHTFGIDITPDLAARGMSAHNPLVGHTGGPELDGEEVTPAEAEAGSPFMVYRKLMPFLGPKDFLLFNGGKPEVYRVNNPDLASVFKVLQPGEAHIFTKMMEGVAKVQRSGITMTPDFTFRALFHGQIASGLFSPHGSLIPFHDVMSGLWDVIGKSDIYQEWIRNGGAASALSDIDTKYVETDMQRLFKEQGINDAAFNLVEHPLDALGQAFMKMVTGARTLQHNLDASARIGVYKRALKDSVSPFKAAIESRKAHLDYAEPFAQPLLNYVSRVVPFFSVGMKVIPQALDGIRDRPITTTLKAAALLTVPAIALRLANYEADKKLPPNMRLDSIPRAYRDMHMILPPINGVRHQISAPYNPLTFLFWTLPNRFMDYALEQNPHAFDGLAGTFLHQVVPPFAASLPTPMLEQWANKNVYNGEPLIPDNLQQSTNSWMQVKAGTTSVSKKIAQLVGPPGLGWADVSPIVLDNYISEWGGTLPIKILQTLDAKMGPAHPLWDPAMAPIIGAFDVRRPEGYQTQQVEDFYTDLQTAEKAHGDLVQALKTGDESLVPPGELNLAGVRLTQIAKAIPHLAQAIRAVNASPDLTQAEKLQYTDEWTDDMITIAKIGSQTIQAIGKGK